MHSCCSVSVTSMEASSNPPSGNDSNVDVREIDAPNPPSGNGSNVDVREIDVPEPSCSHHHYENIPVVYLSNTQDFEDGCMETVV